MLQSGRVCEVRPRHAPEAVWRHARLCGREFPPHVVAARLAMGDCPGIAGEPAVLSLRGPLEV